MKKKGLITVLAAALLLTGCGSKGLEAGEFDCNTLLIEKKGAVQSGITDSFDKDYYKEDELKSFTEEWIEGCNAELMSFLVENKKASMVIKYETVADYAGANRVETELMTYAEAKEKELLPETMVSMTDGSSVARENLEAAEENKVLFVPEDCDVVVKGKLLYYSNAALKSKDSVHTDGKDTSIIIFK